MEKKSKNLNIRVDGALLEAWTAYSKEHSINASALIRKLMASYLVEQGYQLKDDN